jgi:hypothetical protein
MNSPAQAEQIRASNVMVNADFGRRGGMNMMQVNGIRRQLSALATVIPASCKRAPQTLRRGTDSKRGLC